MMPGFPMHLGVAALVAAIFALACILQFLLNALFDGYMEGFSLSEAVAAKMMHHANGGALPTPSTDLKGLLETIHRRVDWELFRDGSASFLSLAYIQEIGRHMCLDDLETMAKRPRGMPNVGIAVLHSMHVNAQRSRSTHVNAKRGRAVAIRVQNDSAKHATSRSTRWSARHASQSPTGCSASGAPGARNATDMVVVASPFVGDPVREDLVVSRDGLVVFAGAVTQEEGAELCHLISTGLF